MHPAITTGAVAIYARFSSDRQRETSIEDQVRRCRDHIARAGGDPDRAHVFSDYAVSGASLDRPGFEAMMDAVERRTVDAIVTEDLSRISRDFADSAMIFKRLQFAQIPLIGVADGIDTSSRGAKLSFTVKSLVADLYLDDLRDKTRRGLEGRALAGYATGSTPYGYRTTPDKDKHGNILGHKIAIDRKQAAVIVRIFEMYRRGGSLTGIARELTKADIPSPRAGTKHKTASWGSSTIRAILYNEKYAGTWKFGEREWVKVPGTNKRRPRARKAEDVIVQDRPELRIVPPDLWDDVAKRLAAMKRRYTRKSRERVVPGGRRANYLLSGILVCDACGSTMTIHGGSSTHRYYQCSDYRTRRNCTSKLNVPEPVVRKRILKAIEDALTSPEGIAYVRKRVAEELGNYSRRLEAEIKEHRERLARTEDRIRGLIEFIAKGEQSDYIADTLRDLEAQARTEKAAIARLEHDITAPLRLPSIDEVTAQVFDLDTRLSRDPITGRGVLRTWLKDEEIRIAATDTDAANSWIARGTLFPLEVFETAHESEQSGGIIPACSNLQSGGSPKTRRRPTTGANAPRDPARNLPENKEENRSGEDPRAACSNFSSGGNVRMLDHAA